MHEQWCCLYLIPGVTKWIEGRKEHCVGTAREKRFILLITRSSSSKAAPKLSVLPGHRVQGVKPKGGSVAGHPFARVVAVMLLSAILSAIFKGIFSYIPRKGLIHLLRWTPRTLRSFLVLQNNLPPKTKHHTGSNMTEKPSAFFLIFTDYKTKQMANQVMNSASAMLNEQFNYLVPFLMHLCHSQLWESHPAQTLVKISPGTCGRNSQLELVNQYLFNL